MSEDKIFDIAVIGSGGAGQMAMLRAVLNHLDTVVFLGDANTTRRSRSTWVGGVDNVPGMFHKKRPIVATTREVLQFIEERADLRNYLKTIKKAAAGVKKAGDIFKILSDDENIRARFVILCTGTMDVQPMINGSIQPIFPYANNGDILYCIRCDGHKTAGHPTAVMGYSETAGHIAVTIKERYQLPKVFILTNGKSFEGSEKIKELISWHGIDIITGEITEILGDPKGGLEGFVVDGKKVEARKCFAALGSIVYNQLAKELGAQINEREHIITKKNGETSVGGFYAAGDLVAGKKKQVYTAWDQAVDAVDDIDAKIRALKRSK